MVPIVALLVSFVKYREGCRIGIYEGLLGLFLSYMLIRVVVGGVFISSFVSLCLLLVLTYYLSGSLLKGNRFLVISGIVTVNACIMAIYGIVQAAEAFLYKTPFRIIGSFDNQAGYASMLAISTPFVLYLTRSNNTGIKRIAWVVYLIIVTGIVLSASRSGVISMLMVSILYMVKFNKKLSLKGFKRKTICIVLIIGLLIVLYITKKSSADGRILIWNCTTDMITENPLFGNGYRSFEAKYMLHQAEYFRQNPQSSFIMLSDNIKHPFNEFLLFTAEFGLIAIALLLMFFAKIVWTYRNSNNEQMYILLLTLLCIVIFSCFSYPFQYPFTWVVLVIVIRLLSTSSVGNKKLYGLLCSNLVVFSSVALLFISIKNLYYENRFYGAINMRTLNKIKIVSEYKSLYSNLKDNPLFLYNYAVKLNGFNDYTGSLRILKECKESINDYDIQMLLANNYSRLCRFEESQKHYQLAYGMCPNRFMPLYMLMKQNQKTKKTEQAKRIAKIIMDKSTKVPSHTITKIKEDARRLVESD